MKRLTHKANWDQPLIIAEAAQQSEFGTFCGLSLGPYNEHVPPTIKLRTSIEYVTCEECKTAYVAHILRLEAQLEDLKARFDEADFARLRRAGKRVAV